MAGSHCLKKQKLLKLKTNLAVIKSAMKSPSQTEAWSILSKLSKQFKSVDFRLHDLFEEEGRFTFFSVQQEDLLLDYSKNYITPEIMGALQELAKNMGLRESIESMFTGKVVNHSENRAALHTALRVPERENSHTEIIDCLKKMEGFIQRVHSGEWKGHSGKRITDIVNVGIGGSDLGPSLITDALQDYSLRKVAVHFVSNTDPSHLDDILREVSPETTLFVIASKSFTTLETHQNALIARDWIISSSESESDTAIQKHFIAVTANRAAANSFGISEKNVYPLWEWVGGRYSLWSAIGIPIALMIGMDQFRELLSGAHSMDKHFRSASFDKNLPVIMGLLTVWYTGFFDTRSSAVVPYSIRLRKLPAYLQQLYMESLGKRVDLDDHPVKMRTGEILWGTSGTDSQHSYFQFLHQGTDLVPVDFIAFAEPTKKTCTFRKQHKHLLSNCFSQSLALMTGKTNSKAAREVLPGNKPTNTILIKKLTPCNVGRLIALYEHKTFVQSVIWNINAFDQPGVELGKKLSGELYDLFDSQPEQKSLDSSTRGLIKFTNDQQKNN